MAIVYIAPTAQGSADGTSATNAYAYSSLSTAESDAGSGGTILFTDGTYTLSSAQTWDAGGFSDFTYKSLNDNGAYLFNSNTSAESRIITGSASTSTIKLEGFKIANIHFRNDNGTATFNKINKVDTFSANTFNGNGVFRLNNTAVNQITNSSFLIDYSGNDKLFYNLGATTINNCTFFIKCSSASANGITSSTPPSTIKNTIFMSDTSASIADSVIGIGNCTNCCVFQMHSNDNSGGTDNVFADPQFVDATNADLRLRPTSPCIGAGTAS
jgi:hypothetical protein